MLGLSIAFEGVAWWMALREFNARRGNETYISAIKRGKDPSLIVVLFEDSAAMLGLLVALAAMIISQFTGWIYADGLASVIIGLILGLTAIWLAYETKSLLIGERASKDTVQNIKELACQVDIIESVQEVLTMHMGPDFVLVTINADFKDSASAAEVENAIAKFDRLIKEKHSEIKRVFIEAQSIGTADHADCQP